MGVLENIREQYPTLAFLVNDPEIGPLLRDAVDPNKGFSPQTFQAKLYQTGWWNRQSNTQREWLIKSKTDKATANQERSQYRSALSAAAIKFGGHLSGAQLKWLTEVGLSQQLAVDSPEMMAQFRNIIKPGGGRGDVGVAAQKVRSLAESQWFVRPSARSIYQVAGRIASGIDTVESANARFAAEATRRYPHLAGRIQAGETLGDIVSHGRQIVAEELEVEPGRVDPMRNSTWRQLLGVRDAKGNMRMMTDNEIVAFARNRPQWWQTSKGREADSTMVSTMLQAFGRRA